MMTSWRSVFCSLRVTLYPLLVVAGKRLVVNKSAQRSVARTFCHSAMDVS